MRRTLSDAHRSHSRCWPTFIALALSIARGASASSDGTWTHFTTSGFPNSRETLIAADPVGHRIFLFDPSGFSSCGNGNDSYVLDLAKVPPVYQPIQAVGPAPGPRADAAMVFDPVRQRLLVIGGLPCTSSMEGTEVWELSLGDPPRWRQLDPLGTVPGPRYAHVAIYDPVRDRVIVYGGQRGDLYPGYPLSDAWSLSLSPEPSWSLLSPAGADPPALSNALGAYDSRRDRLVLWGGAKQNTPNQDTWALTLGGIPTWSMVATNGTPPAFGSRTGVAYDSLSDRLLTVGPQVGTLDFHSGHWDTLVTTGPSPLPRRLTSAALLPGERRLVNVGGWGPLDLESDVRALDLDSGVWTDLEAIGATPGPLSNVAVDSAGMRVFAEGDNPTQLWLLRLGNPAAWQRPVQSGTPPPAGTPVFWDAAHQRLVTATAEGFWTLTLDPHAAWTFTPVSGPGSRSGNGVLYDAKRDRILLFGGGNASGTYFGDLWELRFEPLPHWALLSGSGPSPRYSSRLGYDPVGDRLILFGGFTSPFNINQAADLWTWPLATDAGWLSLGDQSVPRTGDFIYDYRAHRLLYTVNARVWDVGLDATATWNELHPTGSTTSDPGKAFLDPSEDRLVFPFASIALSFTSSSTPPGIECPPPGGWSPGSIRNASFAVSDRVGTGLTYDYVLSCPRAWPGFPIRGLVPVQPFSKAFVSVGIPVPDTAALGDVSFDLQVLAREQAGVDSSCSFTLTGEAPPVVATGSGAQPDRAWVRWRVEDPGLEATVERRSESGPWTAMARLRADAGSSIAYDDRNVEPDRRYYYRVEINEPGREGTFGETRVDVPRWSLDFASDQPNPLRGRFTVQCLFPAPGEARLEAFDLMGRRRFDATQRVQSPTRATFELDTNERLPAGVYFLRLSLAGETRRRTVVLLR